MDTWNPEANEIFLEALGITSAEERAAYLDRVCANNSQLRAQVEAFLLAHQQAGTFLDTPATASMIGDGRPAESPGAVIGPYKLLEQIGEGGFGVVFMAEQSHPIRRKVALKIIKPGMDTRQVIARFEVERQALALMDHPNIARVFDAGETASGRPYFVMELVKGIPITTYCDQNKLPLRQRLELFIHVCNAVQHAHHKGIVHRDIKPSNILITLHDGEPVVKIIDFGIAKAMGQELTDRTLFTGFAQVLGTPMYASPEQIAMGGMDIDTRTDVYSLGVLLYELLTGSGPYERERLMKAAYDEMRRIIREEDPPRPSQRVTTLGETSTTIASQRASQPRRLAQIFRGELDWIVMKALEKNRSRRYGTPQAFADDITRYLANQPVEARQPTVAYKLSKFVRRHTWGTAVSVCAIFMLVLSTVLIWNEQRKAEAARRRAEKAQIAAVASAEQERSARDAAVLSERRAVMQLADNYTSRGLDDANDNWNARSALWFVNAAVTARDDPWRLQANMIRVNNWLAGQWIPMVAVKQGGDQLAFSPASSRYLMTYSRHGISEKPPVFYDLFTEQELQPSAGFSPTDAVWTNQGQLLLGSETGRVALMSMPELKVIQEWSAGGPVKRVAFSSKGKMVAATSGNKLLVWNILGQDAPRTFEHPAEIVHVAFASTGGHLLTATRADNKARAFSVNAKDSESPDLQLTVGPVDHIISGGWYNRFPAFVNGGQELYTIQAPTTITFYDVSSGAKTATTTDQRFTSGGLHCVSVSTDGRMMGVGPMLNDVVSKRIFRGLEYSLGHNFSLDGKYFATTAKGLNVYAVSSDKVSRVFPTLGKSGQPAFSHDGNFLATVQLGLVQVWKLPIDGGEDAVNKVKVTGARSRAAFSRDGQFVAPIGNVGGTSVRTVRVCATATCKAAGKSLELEDALVGADFSPDGKSLVAATGAKCAKKQVRLWNWQSGSLLWDPVLLEGEPASVRFSPDGKALAVHCINGSALLIDAATGHELLRVQCAATRGNTNSYPWLAGRGTICFSLDGHTFYTWGSPVIQAWDRATGKERFSVRHSDNCWTIAESSDGRLLATGSYDNQLRIWDTSDGREIQAPIEHPNQVLSVAFSPDGLKVATACLDWQTRVWDVATGKLVYAMSPEEFPTDIRFTRDGRFTVTGGTGSIQLWDAKTGLAITPLLNTGSGTTPLLDLSIDGKWAVIAGDSDTYAVIPLEKVLQSRKSPDEALLWNEVVSNSRITGSSVTSLSNAEWMERWHAYRATYPRDTSADFAFSLTQAEAHLDAETLARRGNFREAAQVFQAAIAGGSAGFDTLRMAAHVHLQAGNQAEYAECCREFYGRFKNETADSLRERLAKTCAIGASSIEVSRLETLLNYPRQPGDKPRGWTDLCKGIVFYRGGKWRQSIEALTQSLAVNNGPEAQAGALFYQAMSYWQLQDEDQARVALQKGRQVADTKLVLEAGQGDLGTLWMDWIMVYQARQEAEKLIGDLPATRPTNPATRATIAPPAADMKLVAAGERSLSSHALTGPSPP